METRLIYFLYRLVGAAFIPFVLLYFALRVLRNGRYRASIWQRFGFLPREYNQTSTGAVWFHAVSVGETLALEPLIRQMRERLPSAPVFLSATTLAGYRAARERYAPEVRVFYAPVDYAWAARRVLRRLRPSLVVIAETEIWPNLYREVRRTGAPLALVNGRISDKAMPQYRRWRGLFGAALREADAILAQSEPMRTRFVEAGAGAEAVQVTGNLKYDLHMREGHAAPLVREFFRGRKVWVAASTSEAGGLAEEDAVIAAFRQLEGWGLLLAPRKPERFGEVARKLERAGLTFSRRTDLVPGERGSVLLLNTVGELAGFFGVADAVFVGGSLAPVGGHNVLEPAFFGKSITVGPHMENFREIVAEFLEARAMRRIRDAADLTPFADSEMGERARALAKRNRGATAKTAEVLERLYRQALPEMRRSLPARVWLTPFTWAWAWGGARRRARFARERRHLAIPVISVGNITVGGTGKTPTVRHLAQWLSDSGRRPGVLTRGHGRASPQGISVIARGGSASRAHTGDEAQLLLRSGLVALGIATDRVAAAREMERLGLADVLLLDDGFQHTRVARDLDLVLIDALAPFGDGELVPLGRLREPMRELRRASAFLITRVTSGAPVQAIEARLKRWNPEAPVFRSRVVAKRWREVGSGEEFPVSSPPFRKMLAFCGLGNPRSFWNTLRDLEIHPMECLEYGDHHLYTPREVRRFGQLGRVLGAEALLTTEKDAVNLCELATEAVRPMRILALEIGMEIDQEREFLTLVERSIARKTPGA